jgi:hypothetical protein
MVEVLNSLVSVILLLQKREKGGGGGLSTTGNKQPVLAGTVSEILVLCD